MEGGFEMEHLGQLDFQSSWTRRGQRATRQRLEKRPLLRGLPTRHMPLVWQNRPLHEPADWTLNLHSRQARGPGSDPGLAPASSRFGHWLRVWETGCRGISDPGLGIPRGGAGMRSGRVRATNHFPTPGSVRRPGLHSKGWCPGVGGQEGGFPQACDGGLSLWAACGFACGWRGSR